MLRYRKCPNGKSGNGYKGKKYVHDKETIVCYFYGKVGHMTSKCSHLPKTRLFNAFRTNQKGPKKFVVPKVKIILVADIFNHNKNTPIMEPGQWLLTSHDMRKMYIPMSDPHAWWSNHFRREDRKSRKDKY